jgi:integrase
VRGAVRRRGVGWEYYYRELDPGTGRWRQRSKGGFPTRAEAVAALRTVLHGMDRGAYVSPTKLTVREYLEERWLPAITMTLRPSTHASYTRVIRLHVTPRIGAVPLQKLDAMMLNDVYLQLMTDGRVRGPGGLSVRTVRYVHFIVHRALRDAMRWQLLSRNVSDAADPPKESAHLRPEITTWPAETVRLFLEGTRADRRHAAWLLLASTGMRRGEVLGLRWADIDFRAGQLAIRQTLVTADLATLFGEPKSRRSRRVVALDATTLDTLQRHRRVQLEEKLALGPAYCDQDLVFTRRDGRPYEPDEFSREFDRKQKRLGLPRIRLHDLRHTWATLALQSGIHPKVVSERLGHSTIAITLDTYSHVTPSMQRDAANQVAAVIFGTGPRR